jgi:F-type H+-transporting ATPase subunit b
MSFNLTLIAQMLAFAAFILFTVKVVWPPLLRVIEARQKTIADGLAAGERGKQDLENAAKRAAAMMSEARQQVQDTIAQADKRGTQIIEEAKGTAKTEGDRLVSAAKAEIEQEVARAKEALREQVAALAIAGAEKILRREVDAKAHADLLAQLKQELR